MPEHRRTTTSAEKARLRYFLWAMIEKHQPLCPICKQAFTLADALPPRGIDNLTEHHLDGDHENMAPSNRVLVHRSCHKQYHVKDNIRRPRENRVLGDYR